MFAPLTVIAFSVSVSNSRRVQTASEQQMLAEGRKFWPPWKRSHNTSVEKVHAVPVIPIAEQEVLQKARGDAHAMKEAYESFKTKLDADPENLALKLACAEAIVSMMRIFGNANALTCYLKGEKPDIRKSDTAENMEFWSEWAPIAERLLSDIEKTIGKDAFNNEGMTCSMKLEAGMYASSSRGIVSATLSGHALAFLGNLGKLEELHPSWDGAQHYIYRGSYYLAAPWPLYDAKKGAASFESAIKDFPSSRRNQYFAGVGRFAIGDFSGAREAMEKSLAEPCQSSSEQDICDFVNREANRTIFLLGDRSN